MLESKKFNKHVKEVKHEEHVEEKVEIQEETAPTLIENVLEDIVVKGKVICDLLNVRKDPNIGAEVVTILPIDSIVTICDTNATPDFYKILVGDLEGYCMKKFMTIVE